jgi:hypothetical protein
MSAAMSHSYETTLPTAGVHYLLEAYVCQSGTKPSPFEGWVTFPQICQQRPADCRFAVAQLVPVFEAHPRGPFVCWDLRNFTIGERTPRWRNPPDPVWTGRSADGLIMKCLALYESGV